MLLVRLVSPMGKPLSPLDRIIEGASIQRRQRNAAVFIEIVLRRGIRSDVGEVDYLQAYRSLIPVARIFLQTQMC